MALNLFETADRSAIEGRLAALQPDAQRQWGKMTVSQMLAHCSVGLEAATGDRPMKRMPLGYLLGWLARGPMLNEKPFQHDAPTHPDFKIRDDRDFAAEKQRLTGLLKKFCDRGRAGAEGATHAFLGALTGEEWGRLMYKHLDHHFRQFAA